MKSSLRVRGARALTATVFAAAPVLALAPPAAAESFDINFACSGDSPVGQQEFSLGQSADVVAPETVAPGGNLDIVIDPAVNTVPAEVNGYTVKEVDGLDLRIPIPENSTLVSTDMEGGSGLGGAEPTLTVEGDTAILHVDGPMAGGSEFELPTVTAHLTAGDSGAIETRLDGTSYDDPGLTFNAVVETLLGDTDVPSSCYPDPNPVLTTTAIE
ncbi:hypothetical protein [Parasphingorhabdus pacifica]